MTPMPLFVLQAYDASAVAGEGCRAENEELMMENVKLRDQLSLLEGLAGVCVCLHMCVA